MAIFIDLYDSSSNVSICHANPTSLDISLQTHISPTFILTTTIHLLMLTVELLISIYSIFIFESSSSWLAFESGILVVYRSYS
jgi:hypothetical protein